LAVTASLVGGYFYDPYVFAFAVLILGSLSIGVAIVGLGFVIFGALPGPGARLAIMVPLAFTGVVLGAAFAILGTFKWA